MLSKIPTGYDPMKAVEGGSIQLIEKWGSDERIIDSARMSTNKAFQGWDKDEKLLRYLYTHRHFTPFEMCGLTVEVEAPIFVFREWHRHRTQSYNEMSARYIPMPDKNYLPTKKRLVEGSQPTANKQAQGAMPIDDEEASRFQEALNSHYNAGQHLYESALARGISKELARLCVPVGRFSKMRASANLRNWIGFLSLRMDPAAQWEIRQYALCLSNIISEQFPRTHALFTEEFLSAHQQAYTKINS